MHVQCFMLFRLGMCFCVFCITYLVFPDTRLRNCFIYSPKLNVKFFFFNLPVYIITKGPGVA
jgi:hypothetical protein